MNNSLYSTRMHEGLALAELARLSGLSEHTVRDIERGKRRGREVTLHKIVNALNENRNRRRRVQYTVPDVFPLEWPQLTPPSRAVRPRSGSQEG